MRSLTADFLVIGGGIIGLGLAHQLRRRYPDCSVVLIEKESRVGMHASGRNSGVLHAGFYYTSDSLKAKFAREGNRLLTEYCIERGLRINRCGKLVVVQEEYELPILHKLLERGKRNGVELYEVSEQEAKEIEPRAKTIEKALYSPTTSSVDPGSVTASLFGEVKRMGVNILTNTSFVDRKGNSILTSNGTISAAYVVNAAGLYADKVAKKYGFCKNYHILPFKGLYLYNNDPNDILKTHIYPVPSLDHPFLGVHFTLTAGDGIKLGPTAIPAFWRENYHGVRNYSFTEMRELLYHEIRLLVKSNFGFRTLACKEMNKYKKRNLIAMGARMIDGVCPDQYKNWAPAGIRAQLYNIKERNLVMDFCFEGDDRSFHVLNAVSPAFTCALPFTEYLVDRIEGFFH